MALVDLLPQFGISLDDREAVFRFLLAAPLAPRSRVELWSEYAQGRGFQVTDGERATLSA